ncbi:unnamed protein product [Amoebophrya sp. A25]|nr:unnamed protein product [Amoebophrya sp. A25]|eukprot:GSA25T00018095001.1
MNLLAQLLRHVADDLEHFLATSAARTTEGATARLSTTKHANGRNQWTSFMFDGLGEEESGTPEGTGEKAQLCPADGSPCDVGCPQRACKEGTNAQTGEPEYCPQDDPSFKEKLKKCPRTGCPKNGCVKNAPKRMPYMLRPCSSGLTEEGSPYPNFARRGIWCDDPEHPNNVICVQALPNDWCKWSVSQKPTGLRVGWSEHTSPDGTRFYSYDKDRDQEFVPDKPENVVIHTGKDDEDAEEIWDRDKTYIKPVPMPWHSGVSSKSGREVETTDVKSFLGFASSAIPASARYQLNETCCTEKEGFCKRSESLPMCVTVEQYRNYLQSGQNLFINCPATRDQAASGCWWSNELAWDHFGGKSGAVPGYVSVDQVTPPIPGKKLS